MVGLCDNVANVGLLASGPLAGGSKIVGLSHLRFAAGVCVLAAGLLMGGAGGAVAVADPDSSGSAANGDDGTNASGQDSTTASSPVKGVTSTLGSGPQPGQQPSTDAKTPKKEPGGTDTKDEKKDTKDEKKDTEGREERLGRRRRGSRSRLAGPVAAAPDRGRAGPQCGRRRSPTAVAPAPDAAPAPSAAPAPDAVGAGSPTSIGAGPQCGRRRFPMWSAPVSDVIASVQDMLTPVAGAVVPLTQLQSSIQDMLTSVAGAVVPLTQLQSDLYSFLLGSDVIALVQDMLTSVAGAVVPLTQLQSEFYSFLLGIAGMEPVVAGLGGVAGAGLSPAADAWVVSQWRLVLSLAAILGGPLAGNATGVGTLGGIAASIFGATTPPLAPNGAISMGVQSFFRHADSELLLPGSLSASARRRRACDPYRSRGATHFTGGAGRSRSARRRRACDPYRSRGARRIPPGQSRFRIADSGHRALRPSGGRSVRCRPFGVIGCRPSEGIARRPSGGVKRRMSSR